MNTEVRNIFVVGLDPFNLKFLRNVRKAHRYAFHELLDYDEIAGARRFDMEALLDIARGTLRAFSGEVHAIVGYWDFPGVLMMSIPRAECGLRGPSLESVLMCGRKYLVTARGAGIEGRQCAGTGICKVRSDRPQTSRDTLELVAGRKSIAALRRHQIGHS